MARPSKPGSENRRFIAYSVRSQTCSEWRATRICLQYVSVRFAATSGRSLGTSGRTSPGDGPCASVSRTATSDRRGFLELEPAELTAQMWITA
jgi:hypothetical protein